MDRGVILSLEAWAGVPKQTRELAQHLYDKAVVRIDTAHGLTPPSSLANMLSGSVQGCVLSTEKARLLMNSLAEAVSILAEGVTMWNGGQSRDGDPEHACIFNQAGFGDDMTLPATSWAAVVDLVAILDVWASTVNSALGIDGYSKLCITGVIFDEKGKAQDVAYMRKGASPLIRLRDGRSVPVMPMNKAYAQVGFRWRLDGSQADQVKHLKKLLAAWLARVGRVRNLNEAEFAELTNLGFQGLIGFYGALLPISFEMAEKIAEIPRRRLFNRKFGYPDGTPKVDRYFRSAGSKRYPRIWRSCGRLS